MDPPLSVAGLPVVESVKCLGVWWCSNSTSRKSVEERISKAPSAFIAYCDLGAFHSLLNPLSSWSFVECCVMPVLMYGAEAWYINASFAIKVTIIPITNRQEDSKTVKVYCKPGSSASSKLAHNEMPLSVC